MPRIIKISYGKNAHKDGILLDYLNCAKEYNEQKKHRDNYHRL